MNGILQQKISIVTTKPQTTRHKILGILSGENYQIIFLDTPGVLKPKYRLQNAMMKFTHSAIEDADIVLFMIDAAKAKIVGIDNENPGLTILKDAKKIVYLIMNKVDLVHKPSLLPLIDFYSKYFQFAEIFPISARTCEGMDGLVNSIIKKLPLHPPYYPMDIVSDRSERFFVAEMVREKIFQKLRHEVPYSTTVEIVEFKEREGQKDFISADIYVERQSQKGILIGKNGAMLKMVGELARKDVETFLGRPVFLELHVKVQEKWRNNEALLKRLGYKV